jgi:hypothetical protein
MKKLNLKIRWIFLKLSRIVDRRDHTKDSEKFPIHQFQLLITGIKRNPNLAGDGETVVESVF